MNLAARVTRLRPPRIAMTLLVVAAAANVAMPIEPIGALHLPTAAALVTLAGFGIMIQAWRQFRDHATAVCPTERSSALVTDGVYRFTRNPMYLGITLMLSGVAMYAGTLPFVAAALAFFVIIDRFFVPFEEDRLVRAFGSRYERYRASVRRWI